MEFCTIGKIQIPKTAALAPMASVCDYAFRKMCKDFGAAYVVGEMVSAKGLAFSSKKSDELLRVTDAERPMGVQLFGSEPEYIEFGVKKALEYNPDIIDINCGCPVPKVVGNGAGSALLKTPELLGKIVKSAVSVSSVPITVKIRTGWDEESINAVETAKIAEENGAAAIAVHARTRSQMYSGKADISIIKQVKKAVNIPVIGNGDVASVNDCIKMYEETGCDLVMIGRAACGAPWIFSQIDAYFRGLQVPEEPSLNEKLDIMKKHIKLLVEDKGEYIGMKEARKHTGWYIKGIANAAYYRNVCGTLSTLNDLDKMIESIRKENKDETN